MANHWNTVHPVKQCLIGIIILMMMVSLGVLNPLIVGYAESDHVNSEYRISGANRYQTAYEIALRSYPETDTVIIVRGDSIDGIPQVVDGLTASGLAGAKKAPILLTEQNRLHTDTKEGIIALSPKKAIIVGGPAAVSETVEEEIKGMNIEVERVRGVDRYDTAAQVALAMKSAKEMTAIIVDGYAEVDSLVAGPLAHSGHPILLVNNRQGTIPAPTLDALKQLQIKNVWIVGGTGVVSPEIENALNDLDGITVTKRFSGSNRVETSLSVGNHEIFHHVPGVSLVNGWNYVDAVAASTLGQPVVYFHEAHGLIAEVHQLLKMKTTVKGIGGFGVVPDSIIKDALMSINAAELQSLRTVRYTRHNERYSEVLSRQLNRSDLKLWTGSTWITPRHEEIDFYLDSRNFYDENRLSDFHPTERVKISTGVLNFRSSPVVRSDTLIGTVSRGEIYEVYDEFRGWFNISVDDEMGWIHGDYVHRKSQAMDLSRKSAEVTTSALNVRMGPTTDFERIGAITLGEQYTFLEELNGWYRIQYFDKQAWISGSFAKIVEDLRQEKMQFFTLDGVLGVSGSELNSVLSGHGILEGLGPVFKDAAGENQLNELYLVSHALAEREGPLMDLVEGVEVTEIDGKAVPPTVVYNVFGINGKGENPEKAAAEFAYEQGWNTMEKSIVEGAKWISKEYVHHPARTQNTFYKMAWDPSDRSLNAFSSDIAWATRQGKKLNYVYRVLDRSASGFDLSTYQMRVWPVPGLYRISSPYGYRWHPIDG